MTGGLTTADVLLTSQEGVTTLKVFEVTYSLNEVPCQRYVWFVFKWQMKLSLCFLLSIQLQCLHLQTRFSVPLSMTSTKYYLACQSVCDIRPLFGIQQNEMK
ncbi:Hypothetical_protein [Hexamita inflata]|uniref:Hypothetical_protein n=1 Tax=Hexamita inflata TaxID=28002 RepID=A0AA86RDI8_9EUKA|nr:Hypothetical protein HINF_LOCUS63230 [Hexamita inflata]